ncbi:hypothetical protein HZH68_010783 [Vespula germanica]|uniref:Uncharacterized protein n=1 Tax=Vespula germanica TaxID=30212 RepID=A0A834N3U1_VESGE|nr:hypothetical protein HZH68_010783 [Vespula germanica]
MPQDSKGNLRKLFRILRFKAVVFASKQKFDLRSGFCVNPLFFFSYRREEDREVSSVISSAIDRSGKVVEDYRRVLCKDERQKRDEAIRPVTAVVTRHRPAAILETKERIFGGIASSSEPSYLAGRFVGRNKRREAEESWITCVECLRAPSDWCSRLGAEPVVVVEAPAEEEAALVRMASSVRVTSLGPPVPAPARPDCATTTAATNSTRSPSSAVASPSPAALSSDLFPLPPHPAIAPLTNMAADRPFTA